MTDIATAATRDERPKGWHAEQIKAAIRMRGVTLGQLGERNGLSESCCRAALLRSQPKAELVISAFLGVPLHELWPDRYDEDGGRIRHVRSEDSHERDGAHRLNEGAA
jgi:Ner family transcriptional regulator